MYTNQSNLYENYQYPYYQDDERFMFAPFILGGLAGTALGYGIANNHQQSYTPMVPMYPIYPAYPVFPSYSSNYYYY